jgi:hypothetical protein
VPRLRGVGTDAGGPFLLETIVAGASLRELRDAWDGAVPLALAAHVGLEAARLVERLHALEDEAGRIELVHADLCPDNLRFAETGKVGLLDFGHARVRGAAPAAGSPRGAPAYLAPELARGEVAPSQATDVYALAATVAWLALHGPSPLVDPSGEAALLASVGDRGIDPARVGPLPRVLREALVGLLAFDPALRRGDMSTLSSALVRCTGGSP